MDVKMRDGFTTRWNRYFGDAGLPIAIFYTDEPLADPSVAKLGARCVIGLLSRIVAGETLSMDKESLACGGAKKYLGFTADVPMKDFDYFLSTGIPGRVEGERYKKSPEIVRESMKHSPSFVAPGRYINFRRWDKLTEADQPQIILFLANQDVISGLFTLANFDEVEPNAVICPFGSGCSSIVYHPYVELQSTRPRCVMGMFDISARPYVGENIISFAVPVTKFERMTGNMDESFLSTDTWKRLYRRMNA